MKPTYNEIKGLVDAIAFKIQAPADWLPTYGNSRDGHPNIEIDKNGQLYYEIYERGNEIRRDWPVNVDDLLCLVFADIATMMAHKYELNHRIENQDFRRQWFAKEEEILGSINENWRKLCVKEHEWVLRNYPFNDNL